MKPIDKRCYGFAMLYMKFSDGRLTSRLLTAVFAILPVVAFAQEPENQSDGARYEAALRSTRCAQLSSRSAPDWFRRGFVYQIQPRAFTPEGTLKAATAKLPLVRESGAGIVYLMPVNVLDDETNQLSRICRELGQPKGFYRTKDYFNTDPEFGSNADRKAFVDECHRLGMKVIFDIVLYHCGPSAVLIRKNPNWVLRNPDGSIRLGKWGRPVLNFKEQGLREYLYVLLGYLVADVGVDGFRCDVAETQPLDFWEEAHRRLSAIKSDVVLLCEGYGCPGEQEKAFDCCYDWKGMEALRGALDGRVPLSRIREEWTVKRTHCERGARFLRYVENHDETDASQNKGPRGDSDERWGRKRMEAALFYCFTSDGVPFLYNGNEFADRSFQRMLLKTPIDWSARDTPEGRERLAFVQRFARLRQTDDAFSTDAALAWVDNDCPNAVLSYVKQAPGSKWLCVVNLSKSAQKATVTGYGRYDLAPGEWKLIRRDPDADGPRADLRVLPGGALRLLDADVTLRPGLYTESWRFQGSSAPIAGYAPDADGSWTFEIGKGTGLTGSGAFSKCPDGRIRASWTIEPKADVESNGLVVMTALDGAVWRGGCVEADGRRVELPLESTSSRILSGTFSKLVFSDAKAERGFTLEFDRPQTLLLQDDRAVVKSCPTLTLRLFLSPGRCSAGKAYRLETWFSGKSVGDFEEIRPVTVAEGAEWMPIACDPDVIGGSALDFSGVMPGRHRPAGRFGRVVAVGEDFQFEGLPGVAQRFAGANVCGPSVALDEEVSKKLARRFSAVGYNSVRIHNHDWVFCRGQADGTALDEAALRKFDALFAAFKDEGHYMTIDLFVNRKVPWRSCGIDRDGVLSMGDFKLWVQFHEGVFSNFLAHADAFLSRVNVKTGIRYADDPALAFVSLVNEGNLGNGGRDGLAKCPPAASAYAAYVASQGGKDDDGLLAKFWAEREAAFARRVRRHMREDLKCRVLLTNMNAWFYTPEIDQVRKSEFDYADQHCYVAHPTFLGKDWSPPTAGDMRNPLEGNEAFYLASRRLSGLPFVCSEWNYCVPLPARAQAGLVMGSLAASGRWNALWRYAWSDDPRPVLAPRSTPVQFFMIGADPLALATERATTCLFLRHDADALGPALERARRERRIVVDAKGTSGGWCAGGELDAGFLKAKTSGPAAVWASALDGADLASARRLAVFHLTEVLNSGMKFSDGRLTMMSDGGHCPLLVRKGEARISLPLEGAGWRLYALSSNGARKKELELRDSRGRKVFAAQTDCDASDGTLAYELIREE